MRATVLIRKKSRCICLPKHGSTPWERSISAPPAVKRNKKPNRRNTEAGISKY